MNGLGFDGALVQERNERLLREAREARLGKQAPRPRRIRFFRPLARSPRAAA